VAGRVRARIITEAATTEIIEGRRSRMRD
jgi:hypothetical protein